MTLKGHKNYKILMEFYLSFPEELSMKDVDTEVRNIIVAWLPKLPLDIREATVAEIDRNQK